ncbi:MAG: hypothetical protein RL149_991 [Actinomycetota bacterium]|jgi:hypothetical protein
MSKSSHALRGAFSANRRLQLALAIALLLAAIGVVFSLNRPATTVEYLVATRDLPSGTELQAAAFKAVPLALGGLGANYLTQLPSGRLSTPVRAGELLERSAVGLTGPRYSIVLSPSQPVATGIRVGSKVDVWFVAKSNSIDVAVQPVQVAAGLEVRSIQAIDQGLSEGLSKVELAAQATDLPGLLLASSNSGFISVIGAN